MRYEFPATDFGSLAHLTSCHVPHHYNYYQFIYSQRHENGCPNMKTNLSFKSTM